MAITYNNLYMDIRQELHRAGIQAATLEARELVCFAAGKTREQFVRDGRLYVPQDVEEQARALVHRHLAGEPLAYLIGEWEFYGLPLDISEQVLIPRSDTEVLAGEAIRWLQTQQDARVLDLCAGSGCVGLAVASQVHACRVVLGNICSIDDRLVGQQIQALYEFRFILADALEPPTRQLGEFDCIVCNPPYIPTQDIETLDVSVRDYEPHMALDGGEDGLEFYRAISENWREALHPGARLYFEVGIGQADSVLRIMRRQGFGELEIVPDTAGIPRVVYGTLYNEI